MTFLSFPRIIYRSQITLAINDSQLFCAALFSEIPYRSNSFVSDHFAANLSHRACNDHNDDTGSSEIEKKANAACIGATKKPGRYQ